MLAYEKIFISKKMYYIVLVLELGHSYGSGQPNELMEARRKLKQYCSYPNVPMTLVERCPLPSSGAAFANPKSDTFGLKSFSSKMLLALKSRWMTRGFESSWR